MNWSFCSRNNSFTRTSSNGTSFSISSDPLMGSPSLSRSLWLSSIAVCSEVIDRSLIQTYLVLLRAWEGKRYLKRVSTELERQSEQIGDLITYNSSSTFLACWKTILIRSFRRSWLLSVHTCIALMFISYKLSMRSWCVSQWLSSRNDSPDSEYVTALVKSGVARALLPASLFIDAYNMRSSGSTLLIRLMRSTGQQVIEHKMSGALSIRTT